MNTLRISTWLALWLCALAIGDSVRAQDDERAWRRKTSLVETNPPAVPAIRVQATAATSDAAAVPVPAVVTARLADSSTRPAATVRASSEALDADRPITTARPTALSAPPEIPADANQTWQTYDISPYTLKVTSTNRPEQAILDWIFRETGCEVWHTEPIAVLSASQRTLRVFAVDELQQVAASVVDRFVNGPVETQGFQLKVVTVGSPSWRGRAQKLLKGMQAQTPGVQAWLMERESAALLLHELGRRNDYKEQGSPTLLVHNGQPGTVSVANPKQYVESITPRPGQWPGYEPRINQVDDGFALELCPLISPDGQTIDATLKVQLSQVERMSSVMLDVASEVTPRQQVRLEVPQVVQSQMHERFRWNSNQVLLVGLGMLPVPGEVGAANPVKKVAGVLPGVWSGPPRADWLVFIEHKPATAAANVVPSGQEGRTAVRNLRRERY